MRKKIIISTVIMVAAMSTCITVYAVSDHVTSNDKLQNTSTKAEHVEDINKNNDGEFLYGGITVSSINATVVSFSEGEIEAKILKSTEEFSKGELIKIKYDQDDAEAIIAEEGDEIYDSLKRGDCINVSFTEYDQDTILDGTITVESMANS